MRKGHIPSEVIIFLLASLFYLPFLGRVHLFDWDEINFAESAREMLTSGEYTYVQINYEPFWEKPPLFIWMQAASMQLFGVGEFAARLPNALCGILTLLVLFWIGKKEFDERMGWLWVLAHGASILPFLYFKSGIIDPWFNLFIFLGLYFGYAYLFKSQKRLLHASLLGLFTGLSMLTKGPVGPLLVGLPAIIFLITNRREKFSIRFLDVLLSLVAFLLSGGFWFFLQILEGRWEVVMDFIVYQVRLFQTQDAGHGGFFGYHLVVLLLGVFPASIFALGELFRKGGEDEGREKDQLALRQLMKITFWVVLVLFSIVKTKIIHYSSLAYFPLGFLAAFFIYSKKEITNWQKGILLFIGSVLGLALFSLLFVDRIVAFFQHSEMVQDSFAKEALKAAVNWGGYEFMPGLLLLGGMIFVGMKGRDSTKAGLWSFGTTGIFIFFALLWVVPRVEKYSQASAIEFFESKSGEDAYLASLNYKSYAPYFYGKVPPGLRKESKDKYWLLTGEIDKPVYFSSKIKYKARLLEVQPELEFLYSKNGFIFFVRKPKPAP